MLLKPVSVTRLMPVRADLDSLWSKPDNLAGHRLSPRVVRVVTQLLVGLLQNGCEVCFLVDQTVRAAVGGHHRADSDLDHSDREPVREGVNVGVGEVSLPASLDLGGEASLNVPRPAADLAFGEEGYVEGPRSLRGSKPLREVLPCGKVVWIGRAGGEAAVVGLDSASEHPPAAEALLWVGSA